MKDIRHEPMNVNNIHSDVKVGVQIKMLPVVCLTLLHTYAPECDKDTSAEEQWPDDEDA